MIHVHTRYNKISSCIALSKPSSQRKLALITHHSMNFFAKWMGWGDLPALSIHSWCFVLIRSGSFRLRRKSFRQAATSWTWFTPCCSTTEWASENGTMANIENQGWERMCACTQMCVLLIMNFVQRIYLFTQLYSSNTCSFPLDTNISPIVTKG